MTARPIALVGCWLIVALAHRLTAAELTIAPAAGERFSGRLEKIDDEGRFHFLSGGKPRVLSSGELAWMGGRQERLAGPLVALQGGSLLAADLTQFARGELVGENSLLGSLRWPAEKVRGVVLRPPASALARDQLLERITLPAGETDEVVLDSQDRLRGAISGFSADGGGLVCTTTGGPLTISLKKVLAFSLAQTTSQPPVALECPIVLGLADGSRLCVRRVQTKSDSLLIALADGTQLSVDDPALFWARVVYASSSGKSLVWLGDLPSLSYKHVPLLEQTWPFHVDRNVLGGALRARGSVVEHGLGMHSSSRLAWKLPEGFHRFEADLAVDDAAWDEGSVIFRVYLAATDGKWSLASESPVIRGGQPPLPLAVELKDARQIALIVDFADRGDVLDHADWLHARLVK